MPKPKTKPSPKTAPEPKPASADARIAALDAKIEAAGAKKDYVALVRLMDEVRTAIGKVQVVKSGLEALYGRIRFSKLPDAMDAADIENFRVDGVGRCHLQDDITLTEVQKSPLQEWLINNELEDMVTETINHSTLSAFVRNLMKSKDKKDQARLKELKKFMKIKPVTRAVITQ